MAIPRSRPLAAALLALATAAVPAGARAGVGAQAEGGYSSGSATVRDETGSEFSTDTEQWLQRYRLSVENRLYPLLTFGAGGDLRWDIVSSSTEGVPRLEADSRIWNAFARLTAGDRILNGGIDYGRRWDEAELRQGGVTTESPGFVRESVSAAVGWRPADLPVLSLRLSRSNTYDDARERTDSTGDEAMLSAAYQPAKDLDLRYSLRYASATDHLTDVVRRELVNSVATAWSGRYLEGRGTVYLGYNVTARTSDTRAPAGTSVALQQFPVAGLSVVEVFPATPLRVRLNPNGALVDGDLAASAGVNLGTGAGAEPRAPRDLGVQLQDVVTPVNLIHVYVDQEQAIPQSLAALFPWDAYQSDDNEQWTPVPVTAPVVYNPALFRFEVPIERTRARYLKVVTRPLAATATIDPQFREIFVTELQLFDVVPAAEARGTTSDLTGNLSGATRLVLVPELGLAYDFSGAVAHYRTRDPSWSMVNGLSLARRLDPVYGVAARLERADSDAGRGWEATNRWSASLSADPLPTLSALVSYTGQLSQLREGTGIANSGTFAARADLYEGIALGGTASAGWARSPAGVSSRSLLASVNGSLVPNRFVSLTGSLSATATSQSGGGQRSSEDRRALAEGSASLSPFPALALTGSVSHQFLGDTPEITLWNFSGAVSPFPGGDLQLRYAYAETYDTATELRTRSHGPTARWNIRPGWFLNTAYAFNEERAPASRRDTQSFTANLLITLR